MLHDFAAAALIVFVGFAILAALWNMKMNNPIRDCPECGGSGKKMAKVGHSKRVCKRCQNSGSVMTWFIRINAALGNGRAQGKAVGLRK